MQAVATLEAGLFAGAAIYITIAEHPARMECGVSLAAPVFGPSYRRAAAMQASLALIGTFAGVLAWQLGGGIEWLAGSALLFFVMPFTLVAIMRTNKRLLDPALDRNSREAHDLPLKWGRLHAVRSVVGGASFLIFVFVKPWASRQTSGWSWRARPGMLEARSSAHPRCSTAEFREDSLQ